MNEQRNLLIAIAVAIGILLFYQMFVTRPAMEREAARREAQAEQAAEIVAAPVEQVMRSAEEVRATTQRVAIDTPRVRGSLSLDGARIDDIFLRDHYNTVDAKDARDASQQVELLRPRGSNGAFYALIGWATVEGGPQNLPGLDTPWRMVEGVSLTPDSPVTLEYETGGLNFRRTVSVDEEYMFTVEDTV